MMIALLALFLQAGHEFQPADPAWSLLEETLERRADSFIVVNAKDRARGDTWREKRYSEDGRERKMLRYDSQGRLRMEADLLDGEQFTRILRPDGSIAATHHHRNLRMVEAFSFSCDGKTVHHVQDGLGQLVTEGEDGAWNHLLLLPGIIIDKAYRGDRLGRISIWLGNDHYVGTPDGEEHSLYASGEHWRVRDATVDLQIMDMEIADGKLRRREIEPNPDVRSLGGSISITPAVIARIRSEWAAAWPRRRAAFITRVEDALNAAEEDWGRLGLDFIRDGADWPK